MKTTWQDLLDNNSVIIADGATGTVLFEMGLQHGDSPELWNVEQPDKIRRLHKGYVDVGSQIILTNTFGCNRARLGLHELSDRVEELNIAAATLAREIADAAPQAVVVAGSMGPTGNIMLPYGDMEYDEAVSIFEEQARALAKGGVNIFWIETMSDLEEVRAAVEACRRAAPDMPVSATMTFDTNGHTMMGVSPEKALQTLSSFNLAAIGGNCGNGLTEIEKIIEKMGAVNTENTVLIAKSNAGIPQLINGVAVYDATPDDMGIYAQKVRGYGAVIIGGCCGSTPDHIHSIKKAVSGN
jgi:5-methyltetrahydrofolate--homocysteine methyltransferase